MFLMTTSAIFAFAVQAAVNTPRAAFSACLKQASAKALDSKVPVDGYVAHLTNACSAEATAFKNALVNFDVKNGVKRGQASEDAQAQIDDYMAASSENYAARVDPAPAKEASQPAAVNPPVTPPAAATQASAPTPPK